MIYAARLMPLRTVLAVLSVVLSTAFVFAVGELGLRLIFPERVPQTLDLSEIAFEFNESYLVALKKSFTKEFPGEDKVLWRANRDGFRGPELRQADSRVVVYGDSNVLARFSPIEDTFPAQLTKLLSSALSRDVEVINAGVLGFGPDQSLLKMAGEVDRLTPDLIVFHIFADNDFGDLLRNRLFELDESGTLVETSHPRRPDPRFTGEYPFWSSLLLVRAARKVFDPYWSASALQGEFDVYQSGGEQVASHFADFFDADLALYPESPSALVKRALMDEILKRVKQFSVQSGIEIVVVIQPSSFDLTTNLSPNFEIFSEVESYSPRNLTEFSNASAEAAGLQVVNLFDAFQANDPGELYFKHSDNHWNGRGQALAAREVATFILDQGLL